MREMMHAILEWIHRYGSGFGSLVTAVSLVIGGVWSLRTYSRSVRKEKAQWLHELFTSFYLNEQFSRLRTTFEFDRETRIRPLIERVLVDEACDATDEEKQLLCDLDTLLNYFEFILHLESRKQFTETDREALFDYWFRQLKRPEQASLRLYLKRFGYEALCKVIAGKKRCSQSNENIAFYGSLMKDHGTQERLMIENKLRFIGPCKIRGQLYDLGDYPALIETANGSVEAELYEIIDQTVLHSLDQYEEFDHCNLDKSLFVRRAVQLEQPEIDCWVFVYQRSLNAIEPIADSSWNAYKDERATRSSRR